jgi:hypothetical protein
MLLLSSNSITEKKKTAENMVFSIPRDSVAHPVFRTHADVFTHGR